MAQAIATTIYRKTAKSKINSAEASLLKQSVPDLEKMLWGGTIMLIVDHVINGELFFAFREMLTVGVPMSLVITACWVLYALAIKPKKAIA